jgi:carboxyl-terminal processing protease
MPGDYIRAIDGQSTRDTTVFEGQRMLRGKPGTKVHLTVLRGNAAEPHDLDLALEELSASKPVGRIARPGTGVLRIADFGKTIPDQIKSEVSTLTRAGATRLVIDLRGSAFGDLDSGIAAARLFVPSGVLTYRQDRGKEREPVTAVKGDGALTLPVALLIDNGTSGPAELFAAALSGNKRASLVGERTFGRTARQKLIRLPDGGGLMLTHLVYLTPVGAVIHEKGLVPDIGVEQPTVEFGQAPPAGDPTLDRALESLVQRPAA